VERYNFHVFSFARSAEELGEVEKYSIFWIADFLTNMSAKYYKNPTVLSRVIAKNIGDVFLRQSVLIAYRNKLH